MAWMSTHTPCMWFRPPVARCVTARGGGGIFTAAYNPGRTTNRAPHASACGLDPRGSQLQLDAQMHKNQPTQGSTHRATGGSVLRHACRYGYKYASTRTCMGILVLRDTECAPACRCVLYSRRPGMLWPDMHDGHGRRGDVVPDQASMLCPRRRGSRI